MGMYDNLRCHYPLPASGFEGCEFQTKDTPAQFLDDYEIRGDGSLWHLAYDIKPQDDGGWQNVNERWERIPFEGAIRFYDIAGPTGWVEVAAFFVGGKVVGVTQITDR